MLKPLLINKISRDKTVKDEKEKKKKLKVNDSFNGMGVLMDFGT